MDRALYVGMTGAMQTLQAQTVNSQNLANASTTGFKAQLLQAQAVAVGGGGLDSRVNVRSGEGGWDATGGSLQQTGRDLDVSLRDGAWLAVQASDGSEAYTRRGDLQIDAYGQLVTGSGQPVLSEGGLMSIPPASSIHIAGDGTVSIVPQGQGPEAQAVIGRLKVVEGSAMQLQRGADGLMRVRSGVALDSASGNAVLSGTLESSNVNLADTMVNMISLARQFELQTRVMKTTDENAQAAAQVLRMS
jgi:flagellar basal-body rod protein FlgF